MTAAEHSIAPEQVMAYLDGELPPERAREVLAHLAGCETCRQLADDLRGVSQQLTTWTVEPPPSELRTPAVDAAPLAAPRRPIWRRPVAWGLAAAAAVALIATLGGNPLWRTTGREPAEASRQLQAAPVAAMAEAAEVAGAGLPPMAAGQAFQADLSRLIARNARLRLLVEDIDASRVELERIARDINGFIGDIVASSQGTRSVQATLRVPADAFDRAMNALRQMGKVLEESRQAEDVTEQSLDLDARISNGRRTEQRLLQLLASRTGSLEDVLAVERELARIRIELEQLESRRKGLDRRVAYATVRVEITEQARADVSLGPVDVTTRLRNALADGARAALQSLLSVALFAIEVAPAVLLWALILALPAWYAIRRWRRRQDSAAWP
jgi:hypothetical protein